MAKKARVMVLGASGYSGCELLRILHNHAYFDVVAAFSSESSKPQLWREIAASAAGSSDLLIQPWSQNSYGLAASCDAVFLALPHEVSATIAAQLLPLGCKVFDLSGAYRFKDPEQFGETYGFAHPHPELLGDAQYALMELANLDSQGQLFAIPGCYPTAATLALQPACESALLAPASVPTITAISGVSGAGRGANPRTSFCEVSVQAYGVLSHRHSPEIVNNLGTPVVFTPLLGPYKRGILATCVAQLRKGISADQVHQVYQARYQDHPFIRLVQQPPAIDHVAGTPFCHLYIAVQGQNLVVISAIDNLLKGAASQAIQAANHVFGFPRHAGFSGFIREES
ncbi:N-acetyl-gamma-glutamyl-phosphate reductase [Aliidiomarina halalkaliphila]|uniref:N-acetyl-gamma-glutamyl-phosphate reductase n=2 Tax=Aliidiomarina halalkaliphila TaxID=2593535 RepID=A0A552X679_9GAMM|nr:N-acetyl-gamma-glutamyl-phosphate reductase [Aliidiomarina halalkaliphila]